MTGADLQVAREAIASVRSKMDPDQFERVSAVKITAKPRPDAQDIKRGCSTTQKACYFGVPVEVGLQGMPELPSSEGATGEIILFLDNLAPVTLERCFIALAHEYMHALGHDEETIQGMGLWLEDGSVCTPF